jgi:hypothetical protein
MKQRKWLWFAAPLCAVCALGIIGYSYNASVGQTEPIAQVAQLGKQPKAVDPLPIRQVVLFNSGVGYFQREGDVDGNARLELSFPAGDINDLLKSLVLQDPKGQVGAVNYDSSDPIEKILRSFALDLTLNPTFGQILNQARGEKIDITRSEKKDGAATKLSGTIVGMEARNRPITRAQVPRLEAAAMVNFVAAADPDNTVGEMEVLILHTTAGLQSIPMDQIVSVRFQNAVLESEFQRALQVLARSHDTQKKTVSVGFNGVGKRPVKVGYVVERPIWKTTYRLRLDHNGKAFLQGWALVENTSDDDWNEVRMVLVAGKPISFKMNLYDPIYVPRPFVEPELFASLRPPIYSGGMGMGGGMMGMVGAGPPPDPNMNVDGRGKRLEAPADSMGGGLGFGGMQGMQGGNQFQMQTLQILARDAQERAMREQNKLTYEELLQRRKDQVAKIDEAKQKGAAIAGFNFKEGIQSAASADEIGDYYQYTIDRKITLARQKSAMLPILDQNIDGHKVSIFNEAVHAKYPLLGLKLKNSSGQPLTQGPITVYDGGIFAGDTRILDVQPGETRLLSYALDQGTEVKTDTREAPSPDLNFKIGSDTLSAKYYVRQTKTYTIKNRSVHDRLVILEHPIRSAWKLTDPKAALEKTRDLYRFQVAVPAGKTVAYDVVEDMPRVDSFPSKPAHAVANGIGIKVESSLDFHKLTGLKIDKGLLISSFKQRENKAYFVQNLSDMDRTFTVDHVVRPGWARLDEQNDAEKGPAVHRFKLAVAKGKTGQQSVREERSYADAGHLVKSLPEATLRGYLSNPVVSADVKAALTKALGMQAKIADTLKQSAEVNGQLTIVSADHNRVRENLKIVPMTSEHYKTFLEKFVAQDKQIESLQGDLRRLNATMQTQSRDYDQFLAKLDAE